jgi:hypothetical protein
LCLAVGIGVWLGAATVLLVAAALWSAGVSAPRLAGAIGGLASAAGSAAVLLRSEGGASRRRLLVAGLSPIALALSSCALAGQFYDISDDGLAYHQRGVIELARGWNPIRDEPLSSRGGEFFWVDHYAKGAWVVQASIYALVGRIEYAKGTNILLALAAGLLAYSALLALRLRRPLALWIAVLLALNPVALYQALGFYVDGQLASALLALLALLVLGTLRSASPLDLLATTACLVYLSNLKFTGLVYAALIGLGGVAIQAFLGRGRLFAVACAVLAGCLLGVIGPGYNPYLTNTLRAGHPFHPLMGAARVDIMSPQMVPAFGRLGRFEKLVRGHFSRSSDDHTTFPRFKAPFAIVRGELAAFKTPDARVGGFGPWYGGSLLLATILAIGLLALRKPQAGLGLGAIAFISLTAVLNPEAWWARYAPQLWFPPLLLAGWAGSRSDWLRRVGLAVGMALTVNVVLVAGPYLREQLRATATLRTQLRGLVAAAGSRPVVTDLGGVYAVGVRLSEAGLAFERVASPSCANPIVLDSYPSARVCVSAD